MTKQKRKGGKKIMAEEKKAKVAKVKKERVLDKFAIACNELQEQLEAYKFTKEETRRLAGRLAGRYDPRKDKKS